REREQRHDEQDCDALREAAKAKGEHQRAAAAMRSSSSPRASAASGRSNRRAQRAEICSDTDFRYSASRPSRSAISTYSSVDFAMQQSRPISLYRPRVNLPGSCEPGRVTTGTPRDSASQLELHPPK